MRFSKLPRSSGHRCLTWLNKGCTSIPRQWKCELSRWIFTRSQLEWDQVDPRVAKAPCSERECCWWRHRPCVFQQDEDLTLVIPSFGKLLHSRCWNDKIHDSPGCWGALWSSAHQPYFFPSPHIQREDAVFLHTQTMLLTLLTKLELTLLRGACSGWTQSCTADAGRHRGCSPLVFQQAGCDDFKYFLQALSHPSPNDKLRCSGPCMHHFFKEFIFQTTTGNISSLFTLREAKAKIECFTYMVTSWQNSYIWFSWGCLHHFEVAIGSLLVRTFPAQRIVIKIYCAAVASFSYRIIMVRRMVSDGKFSEAWLLWPKRENVLERESDGRNRGRKKAKLCFKKLFYIHSSLEREETSNVFVKQNQG